MRFLALLFVPVLCLAQVCDTAPGRKRAFVIGNGEYRNLPRVATAGQDLQAMKKALEQVGFDVTPVENATMPELYNQQQDGFLSKVHEGDVVFFYYSGHVVQVDGLDDWILPVNFDTSKSVTEALNAFSVNRFLEDLKKQKAALTILMIEGPHDLGGAAIQGISGPGLVIPALKNNGEIVFAMAFEEGHIPNSEPVAGASLFTRTVADLLGKRGPTAARVFDEARTEVLRQPGNGQIPTVDPLLTGSENFCFVEPPPPAVKEIPSVPKNSRDHEEYVKIPHGTFKMGCVPADTKCKDDEKPQHPVTLASDFWLGRNEVKVGSFKHYLEVGNKKLKLRRAPLDYDGWKITELPMVRVTWEEAQDYCKWAGGRLPTEAEWERAARAGNDNEIYPLNSEDSREKANFYGKKGNDTWDGVAPVGQFEASKYNLFDMSGNVWEWVYDWYDDKYYSKSPEADPKGPATGKKHVVRGGSFDSPLEHLRISLRWQPQGTEDLITGFRCVLEDSPETQRVLGRN